jgi:hypothetical protein
MRPFNVKLWGCIVLLTGFVAVLGCGAGNDLLDEAGTQYSAYVVSQDQDGEDTQEIDVWSHACDTDSETIYPMGAKVVITTSTTAADFYVESYDVVFRPNSGTYCEEVAGVVCEYEPLTASQMPDLTGTILNPKQYSYSSPVIKKNTSTTLEGLLVWSQGDKFYYSDTVLPTVPQMDELILDSTETSTGVYEEETADLVYDMQIVLHGRTVENVDITITSPWTPVHFLDVDTCSASTS